MKNNYFAKLIRTLTSILPVQSSRKGSCIDCGECCKLPQRCPFLVEKNPRSTYCRIYKFRPLNCRKYPRTCKEHITKLTCGYRFEK
jgi:hypothetical protein